MKFPGSREFTERTAGCIENIFHAPGEISGKEKREKIKAVITHKDVQEAVRGAQCRSRKMSLLICPVRMQSTVLTYIVYKTIYEMRKRSPVLFHKLKSRR